MTIGRVIPQRVPVCPGRDSRHTIKGNRDRPGRPWWVHYEHPGEDPIPAEDPHEELVELVNWLKEQEGGQAGGAFSINEHGQVIARMSAPPGYQTNAIHVIGIERGTGTVCTYTVPLRFRLREQVLDPTVSTAEGSPWPGPLCGMSYTFAAPGNTLPGVSDEVWIKVAGEDVQLSVETGITPYPPRRGPLADFLAALRRRLPVGGRFRVNEHGRAFASDGVVYIGTVPLRTWFRPLSPMS